jgi:hypothetical protein
VLTRGDLPQLVNLRDTNGHAVSFFFSLQSIPDKLHHTELVLVRDLVREKQHPPGLAEDLQAILSLAEEVRSNPRLWRIAYACRQHSF